MCKLADYIWACDGDAEFESESQDWSDIQMKTWTVSHSGIIVTVALDYINI